VQAHENWNSSSLPLKIIQIAIGTPKRSGLTQKKRGGCTSPVATQFTELDSGWELGETFTAPETARWILYIKVGQLKTSVI